MISCVKGTPSYGPRNVMMALTISKAHAKSQSYGHLIGTDSLSCKLVWQQLQLILG